MCYALNLITVELPKGAKHSFTREGMVKEIHSFIERMKNLHLIISGFNNA